MKRPVKGGNTTYDYNTLKQYVGNLVTGGASLIYQAHLTAKEKTQVPPLLKEIERLKAQLAAQREEESIAGKRALQLYWENCQIQTYKNYAEGILADWVPVSENNAMRRAFENLKLNFDALSRSSSAMEQEWAEFVNKYNDSSAPALIKEVKGQK